jgi:putative glutamine transport system substrate-binding protein
MKAKKVLSILLCLITVVSFGACQQTNNDPPAEDTDPGAGSEASYLLTTFRVGVKSDVPGFSLLNTATNVYEGFEVDLSKKLAAELTGSENNITFTTVTAKTRGPALDENELDAVIATFTITEDRKLSYNFTTPYYTDAVGLLVKKTLGATSLADMDGKKIGVARSATSQDAITAAAAEKGVTVSFDVFDTYPEIKAALDSGRVDAFSVDRSILSGYLEDSVVLLDDKYSPQEYGVATKKTNTELAGKIEELVSKWLGDGTIQSMIDKHNLK